MSENAIDLGNPPVASNTQPTCWAVATVRIDRTAGILRQLRGGIYMSLNDSLALQGSTEPIDATRPIRAPAPPSILRVGYTIRIVRTLEQLEEACSLRVHGYSKRLPDYAAALGRPEPEDTQPGTFIFVATRLSDGCHVGTARLLTNIETPIELETHILLPPSFDRKLLAQGGRLSVVADEDNGIVLKLLMKAMHSCCRALEVSHVLVAAESPRDRFFKSFGFREVYPNQRFLVKSAMSHPASVLHFDMSQTDQFLSNNKQHLSFLKTYCPDVQTFSPLFASWITPRQTA